MTVINTNTAAINAQHNLSKVQSSMDEAMARLSSGKRINAAADDAAGLSIATRMESQIIGMQMTMRNANDGISLVSSVEGALQESTNILQRMYELSVQASNSTYNDSDRAALQDEISQLQTELDRIANDTEFNGQKIADGSFTGKSLNVGFTTGGMIDINIGDHSSAGLSAEGEKDATMSLMNSASNIAVGIANEVASASTVQSAVVKDDTQGISNAMTQNNVGFDNSQKITVTTITENLNNAQTAAMDVYVEVYQAGGTEDTNGGSFTFDAGANDATIANRAAGTNFAQPVIDVNESTAASDGTKQIQSYVLDDLDFQTGDVLETDIDGSGNTVSHTVSYSDFVGDDKTANNLAIAQTFVNKFNAAAVEARASGTADDAGLVTASLSANADGEMMLVFEASNASDNPFDATFTITKYTADTSSSVSSSTSAADGTTGATNTVTLSGTFEEGDVISVTVGDAFSGGSFDYTVKATDLAASASDTRANVTQSLIAAFNAASTDDTFSASAGQYTASATTDTDEIKFTGSEITNATANDISVALTDRTALGAAAAASLTASDLEVTSITNRTGTIIGDVATGAAADAQNTVIRFADADLEVGDVITLQVGDHTLTHEVTTATGAAVATALEALINTPNGTGSANLSLANAGELTATATGAELAIAGTLTGADAAFDVSVTNTNVAAEAQVSIAGIDATVIEEGAKFHFGLGADNKLTVEVTKEMAAMALADANEAIRDAFVAQSDQLLGVTLEAFGTSGNQIKVTATEAGQSFSVLTTASELVTQGDDRAQVDRIMISGLAERGDVFTLDDGTASASVTIGSGTDYDLGLGGGGGIEGLESNEDRINAVVDALIYKYNNEATKTATASRGDALGEILLTADTAGSTITGSDSVAANNSSVTPAVAQENVISLSGAVEEGDVYNISLNNGSSLEYTVTADDAAGGADALQASLISAASGSLTGVNVSDDGNGGIKLTSSQAGVAFEATVTATNAADVAQVEAVSFENVEAGDTFTVSIGADSVSYTASEGDDGASVAAYMASNASFAGKSVSVAEGKLNIEGAGGESFNVATSTSNFAGGIQSDEIEITGTVETDDVYTVMLNDAAVSYAVQDSDSSMADVVNNLASAINASSASSAVTASVSDAGKLVLTANERGAGYDVEVQVSDVGRSRNSVGAIDISTEDGANAAKAVLQGAISQVNETRSELGAIQNRLDHTINNLGNVVVNTEASQSRIEDADFATETSALTKSQILSQAATAMLAQANASKQSVLSLLQG